MPQPTRVLCLAGSPANEEMAELSRLYAAGCIAALQNDGRFAFHIVHVAPDGVWSIPEALEEHALAAAAPLDMAQAVAKIAALGADVGLPQMFCKPGMVAYRALFDLLGLPMIGNPPLQMGLTADKWLARSIVSAAGIAVPEGVLVRRKDGVPAFALPAIVKPVSADNSDGVTLVHEASSVPAALEAAFALGGAAIVEAFIPPGRELRCGVIEWEGGLLCLPPEEYPLDGGARPIRTKNDKLGRDGGGRMKLQAKDAASAWIVGDDDPAIPALHAAALQCYRALDCRQYGLFDFRVDEEGKVWFLEAGLYCSFSPQSVIVMMANAAGIALPDLLAAMADDAMDGARSP